jgi:polyketide cyclase/dehydrase/lipid transport protein
MAQYACAARSELPPWKDQRSGLNRPSRRPVDSFMQSFGVAGDLTQSESGQHQVRPMTIRTESRITIASSVREVWAYVCDVGRWPEWAPTVLECRVRGGAPFQPGSQLDQRAKLMFGLSRGRSQEVIAVEAPRHLAFAGPMGSSAARWGMELDPAGDHETDADMWIEVDLAGIMRAIPSRILQGRIQRVSDIEMVAIKAAVESANPGRGV